MSLVPQSCNVDVRFPIAWYPRHVFPFYQCLYALFDQHRAGKKACLQLLSHLQTQNIENYQKRNAITL